MLADLLFQVGVIVGLIVLLLAAVVWKVRRWLSPVIGAVGRSRFGAGLIDQVHAQRGDVPVDHVDQRDPHGPAAPVLEDDTSLAVIGQTGRGKSTFVKSQILAWDLDEPIIAHTLSSPGRPNEFERFFTGRSGVARVSSRDSTVRWDPFEDFEDDVSAMESIADGLLSARDTAQTGWSEPAQTLLTAALAVTAARHGDFARLDDVLMEGSEFVATEVERVPGADVLASSVQSMDDSDRETAFSSLLNDMRPLLMSDVVDETLPAISLREFFQAGRVDVDGQPSTLVLDNIRKDRFARPFWRFLLQSAIDISFETEDRQRFVLDEVDKLPEISNLGDMASGGRSPGVVGILAWQDVHQLEARYGAAAKSIWSQCPNRVAFAAGDDETADMVLSSIGETEVDQEAVKDVRPLSTREVLSLDVGEAVIQSPSGWWLAKLSEPDL